MAGCEIKRNHGLRGVFKTTELRWVCPDCLAILENPANAVHTEVIEIERRRKVAPFVYPIAGLVSLLVIFSEVLAYFH